LAQIKTYRTMASNTAQILAQTKAWLEQAVIGLNLCPFAKAVYVKNQIRYLVSPAQQEHDLLSALCAELHYLAEASAEKIDTTLIIYPDACIDFLAFNDFLELADHAVDTLGYSGVLQVASFHPQFQFEGTQVDDVTNATNQSPYPMLHLLREDSVERAVATFPQAQTIFETNLHTLETLGSSGWAALQCHWIDQAPR
jgi:uncharacterized protein